ncbi:proteasomal ATPase-associated factor 1-like isoform X2 [Anneissia japonica]|uniref:proteasomal ATPase-associated factor 1-like isoform X2 n=1 Tax=Anneissia japonica TaxID=1529436 RepID=UPI00142570AD|nr:proteasomal ATPase-associated factor 1-like isoform X2 [Anneissia japonica]
MAVRLILQSDWDTALRHNEGQAWISCKTVCPGDQMCANPSIQGELISYGVSGEGVPYVVGSEGFTVEEITKNSIVISHPDKGIRTRFIAPRNIFSDIHNKSIVSLDVSSAGALGVSAGMDGLLRIWQTDSGIVRRELSGHLGDVNCCHFFPSGLVVLSGGSDLQLKIWSVEDGSCPVTLRGHTAGILGVAIVEKGRNIVSCSRDGSARLWDCGNGSCLSVIYKGSSAINACAVGVADDSLNLGVPDIPPSEREIATGDKLLVLACEDGVLIGLGLQSRKEIFRIEHEKAFNCCQMLSKTCIAAGTQDGKIFLVDITDPRDSVKIYHKCNSPVLCLCKHKDGVLVGCGHAR